MQARRSVSETGKPGGCTVSTMDLSEAPGLVLFRVVREGIGISQRLSATGTCAPTGDWDAHPRTRASQEPTDHHQKKIAGDGRGASPETLKRRNGCNLACQREACHGRLDAFGQRSLVKILEWSGLHTRPGGGSFE